MWKSGKSPTAATTFYPQAFVGKMAFFNRLCGKKMKEKFSTDILSTFHRSCGKITDRN